MMAGGVNYIRNSVKVTIDAYHGTTTFHVVDPTDPIAQTVSKIFPGLLQPLDSMPKGLRTASSIRSGSSRFRRRCSGRST